MVLVYIQKLTLTNQPAAGCHAPPVEEEEVVNAIALLHCLLCRRHMKIQFWLAAIIKEDGCKLTSTGGLSIWSCNTLLRSMSAVLWKCSSPSRTLVFFQNYVISAGIRLGQFFFQLFSLLFIITTNKIDISTIQKVITNCSEIHPHSHVVLTIFHFH